LNSPQRCVRRDSEIPARQIGRILCRSAGKRLYLPSSVDHASLFDLLEDAAGDVMLAYDDANEVRNLAIARRFFITPIPMKTTHHIRMYELAITNRRFATSSAAESLRLLEQSPRYRAKRKRAQSRNGKKQSDRRLWPMKEL
jgi:hypothetical protein